MDDFSCPLHPGQVKRRQLMDERNYINSRLDDMLTQLEQRRVTGMDPKKERRLVKQHGIWTQRLLMNSQHIRNVNMEIEMCLDSLSRD